MRPAGGDANAGADQLAVDRRHAPTTDRHTAALIDAAGHHHAPADS